MGDPSNVYRYAGNEVTTATDPFGLQAQKSTVTIKAITPKQLTVTFINLKGDPFDAPAGIPGTRAISQAILQVVLKKILLTINAGAVGKVLFVEFFGLKATELIMQKVRSDIEVTAELFIKECDDSGATTTSKVSQTVKLKLAEIDLGQGGILANDETGIIKAINSIKKKTEQRLLQLNLLVYEAIKKSYPAATVYPLK